MQVPRWKRQILRERAIPPANAQDRPNIAMPAPGSPTPCTLPAANGNLADDPSPDPCAIGRARMLHDAGELVAGNAGETGITTEQLEVGPADSSGCDANETLAIDHRGWSIAERQGTGAQEKRAHAGRVIPSPPTRT